MKTVATGVLTFGAASLVFVIMGGELYMLFQPFELLLLLGVYTLAYKIKHENLLSLLSSIGVLAMLEFGKALMFFNNPKALTNIAISMGVSTLMAFVVFTTIAIRQLQRS